MTQALQVRNATGTSLTINNTSVDPSFGFVTTINTPATTAETDLLIIKGAAGVITRLKKLKVVTNWLTAPTAGSITVKLVRLTALAGGSGATTPAAATPWGIAGSAGAQTTFLLSGGANTGSTVLAEEIIIAPASINVSSVTFDFGGIQIAPPAITGATDYLAVRVTVVASQESQPLLISAWFDEGTV